MSAPVPVLTRDTNAYDLLTEILPRILREEPKRLRMGHFLLQGESGVMFLAKYLLLLKTGTFQWNGSAPEVVALIPTARKEFPRCGTVGCIAGWVCALTGAPTSVGGGDADRQALQILGTPTTETYELFYNRRLTDAKNQGTTRHVEATIEEVLDFAERHKDILKARVVMAPEVKSCRTNK